MFRKICILIISLFALSSCGYTSIYSEQKYYDFSISNLELIGNSQINKNIEKKLTRFKKEKKETDYQIKINSSLNKVTLAKNLKGTETDINIIATINLEITKNNNQETEKISFSKDFAIKKTDSNYEQKNYEAIIINDLSKLLLDQLIIYLSKNNDN